MKTMLAIAERLAESGLEAAYHLSIWIDRARGAWSVARGTGRSIGDEVIREARVRPPARRPAVTAARVARRRSPGRARPRRRWPARQGS
jgi:hypothetical protein